MTLLVESQSKALEFYTKKVGFEKKIDSPTPEGNRWIAVGPKGQNVSLALAEAGWPWPSVGGKKWKADGAPPIVIEVEDCRKTYDDLKSRGVEFTMGVTRVPYGTVAFFADPDGNVFEVHQPPSRTES